MNRSLGRGPVIMVVLAIALLLGACSSGSGSSGAANTAATSSTAAVPGTAKVVSFESPGSVACAADATSATFTLSWKVTGAKKTVVQVDDAPNGSAQADVHCDPLPHDVVLIATDSGGHFTTARNIVNTTGGAGS
jgi:outer membrane biogenesis lipoprotein LolB